MVTLIVELSRDGSGHGPFTSPCPMPTEGARSFIDQQGTGFRALARWTCSFIAGRWTRMSVP
jgi:hypothetical protein